MKVNIHDKEIEMKFSFKGEMLFEAISGESFAAKNTTEWIQIMFCYIIAIEGDGFIKFEDFIKYLDENPDKIYEFIEWYTIQMNNINTLRKAMHEETDEEPKKVSGRAAGKKK